MTVGPRLSRRGLLKGVLGAAGAVTFGIDLTTPVAAPSLAAAAIEVTAWIVIHADDRVTIRIPQTELGQGVSTALAQLVAEEMDLAWGTFATEFFDAQTNRIRHNVYVHTATLNSWAVDLLFDPMRMAGAQVKRLLQQAAAAAFAVSADTLVIAGNQVRDPASGRGLGFGRLAAAAAALPPPDPTTLTLKPAAHWQLIGKPLPRLDARAKSTGAAVYGIDVQVPGMKYAAVRQSPVFGGRLRSFDPRAVLQRKGVHKVVAITAGPSGYTVPDTLWDIIDWQMDDAVAVVADSWWLAQRALDELPVTWDDGAHAQVDSASIAAALARALDAPGQVMREEGDVATAIALAAKVIEAEYHSPYLEHAPLEPMNCTAVVTAAGVEAWAPTQYADEALRIAAYAAQVPLKDVQLHLTLAGGGFGRRLSNDYVNQAVQIAKAVPGVPIKLISAREECMRRGYYAPVAMARFTGALDADSRVTAWKSHVAYGRSPLQPYGMARIPYALPHVRMEYSAVDTPPPFGWMRGVAHSQSLWMNVGFVGELAAAAGRSSYDLQIGLLDAARIADSRVDHADAVARIRRQKQLLEEVARRAGGAHSPTPGRGRGFAATDMSYVPGYHSSCVAIALDVLLDQRGQLTIDKVFAVVDCGLAVNPRIVEAQVQGGIVFGLSNALLGKITLREGRVEQSNFNDYPLLRMAAVPDIEVYIVPSTAHPTGIGEEATPVAIAALIDAIYAAGGPRIRRLPIADQTLTLHAGAR